MQDELYVRVKQALTWLKRNKGILQKDIADKMGMAEASFTRALNRIKEKHDEDFVIAFHSAVSEYISLDYLLNGNGQLLVVKRQQQIIDRAQNIQRDVLGHVVEEPEVSLDFAGEYDPRPHLPTWADTLLGILSKQIAENEILHSELRNSISEIQEMKKQLSEIINKSK